MEVNSTKYMLHACSPELVPSSMASEYKYLGLLLSLNGSLKLSVNTPASQ